MRCKTISRAAASLVLLLVALVFAGCNAANDDDSARVNKPAAQQEAPHCEGGVCAVPSADSDDDARGHAAEHNCNCERRRERAHDGKCGHEEHCDGKCDHGGHCDGKCDRGGAHEHNCDGKCDHDGKCKCDGKCGGECSRRHERRHKNERKRQGGK